MFFNYLLNYFHPSDPDNYITYFVTKYRFMHVYILDIIHSPPKECGDFYHMWCADCTQSGIYSLMFPNDDFVYRSAHGKDTLGDLSLPDERRYERTKIFRICLGSNSGFLA